MHFARPNTNVVFAIDDLHDLELNDSELNNLELNDRYDDADYCPNPYNMNRHNVHIRHFKDSRVYNPEMEPGWSVQNHQAKSAYRHWVQDVRRIHRWQNFRKPPYEEIIDERDQNGDIYIVRKIVYPRVPGRKIDDLILSRKLRENDNPKRKT